MPVTIEDIQKTAGLAKLSIRTEDLPDFCDKFNRILELNKQLDLVDIKHVEPLYNPLEKDQPLREDVVTATNQRDLFLSISPTAKHPGTQEGLYVVPRVIETE